MEKLFFKVVKIVQLETETTEYQLFRDKHEEYVSYRVLLIYALSKLGYTDRTISDRLGITRQGVCWLRNQFTSRLRNRYTLASHWKVIEKQLQNIEND